MGAETITLIASGVLVGGAIVIITLIALVAYWMTHWF